MIRRVMPWCCAGLFAACAHVPFPGPDASRQVTDLIADARRVAALPPEEQRRELAMASQIYERDRGNYVRLRLGLLLALPGTPINDDIRAAGLIEPLAGASAATPLRQFAWLLYGQVTERLREQKKSSQFKEQLDGLRAIERSLIERRQGRGR